MSAEILCFNGLVFAQYSVYTVAILFTIVYFARWNINDNDNNEWVLCLSAVFYKC